MTATATTKIEMGQQVEVLRGGFAGSIGIVTGQYRSCNQPYDVRLTEARWYGEAVSPRTLTLHAGEFQ